MRFCQLIFLVLSLMIVAEHAHARKWKPKPHELASEYSMISDMRSRTELVIINWVAPEGVAEGSPGYETGRQILREYMLVGVAHANFSLTGRADYKSPEGLSVQPANEQPRPPLARETLPPAVVGLLAGIQAFFSQAMGSIGQGFHWFVFDGKGIRSCDKGSFVIAYAGERYTYDTPIPGCP